MTNTDRITGPAAKSYLKLSASQQRAIDQYLEANPYSTIHDNRDLVEAWLIWEGIIGFTDDIIAIVQSVYKV